MKKDKFLIYPVCLLLFLFAFDKIFLFDFIKNSFKKDFTYIYYETREEVLKNLKINYSKFQDKNKFMIILGSSRLIYFSNNELLSFYPNWEIYNLSAAVATPAYYFFFLEKMKQIEIKPELIVLEIDSNQFNENTKDIFKKSNLTYSFNLPFVLKYSNIFGNDYVSYYIRNTLFAVSKNKPLFSSFLEKLKDGDLIQVNLIANYTKKYLIENKGHSFSHIEDYYEKNFAILEQNSVQTFKWAFQEHKDFNLQFVFYEMLLKTLQKQKIKTIILKSQVSIPLYKLIQKEHSIQKWNTKITNMTKNYGFEIIDLSKQDNFYCNSFADGGHMARECYRPLMRLIMNTYHKK